ncbi:hypothetical protein AB0940_18165 [Streptomyces sp. NPDC006656]|uniref:hypothetical protein n=1 Tax=Streptomyces sp. NPDC006656 TaxID=3156899 RepID=UPI00345332BB
MKHRRSPSRSGRRGRGRGRLTKPAHRIEQSLAAAQAYHVLHSMLAAPQGAAILDARIGQ